MRIVVASEPGSSAEANQDGVVVRGDTVAVLDGATARTDTGCRHGVAWFVQRLSEALARYSDLNAAEALAAAIGDTAKRHCGTCDLTLPGTPSAAVGVVQMRGGALHYLLLGDITLVVQSIDRLQVHTDDRVTATARTERDAADAIPGGTPEKAQALLRMKRAELTSRNVVGGFWIAAADPSVVTHAVIGEIPLAKVQSAALLSDGAARITDLMNLYDWPGFFGALRLGGPADLIRQIRAAEDSDPHGIRWPRNKIHDDATIALVEC